MVLEDAPEKSELERDEHSTEAVDPGRRAGGGRSSGEGARRSSRQAGDACHCSAVTNGLASVNI